MAACQGAACDQGPTLKDLADQRSDNLLAHDAQLPIPQRILQDLRKPYLGPPVSQLLPRKGQPKPHAEPDLDCLVAITCCFGTGEAPGPIARAPGRHCTQKSMLMSHRGVHYHTGTPHAIICMSPMADDRWAPTSATALLSSGTAPLLPPPPRPPLPPLFVIAAACCCVGVVTCRAAWQNSCLYASQM